MVLTAGRLGPLMLGTCKSLLFHRAGCAARPLIQYLLCSLSVRAWRPRAWFAGISSIAIASIRILVVLLQRIAMSMWTCTVVSCKLMTAPSVLLSMIFIISVFAWFL